MNRASTTWEPFGTLSIPTLSDGFLRKVVSARGESSGLPKPSFREIEKNAENLPENTIILDYCRERFSKKCLTAALARLS